MLSAFNLVSKIEKYFYPHGRKNQRVYIRSTLNLFKKIYAIASQNIDQEAGIEYASRLVNKDIVPVVCAYDRSLVIGLIGYMRL